MNYDDLRKSYTCVLVISYHNKIHALHSFYFSLNEKQKINKYKVACKKNMKNFGLHTYHSVNTKKKKHNKECYSPEVRCWHHGHSRGICDECQSRASGGHVPYWDSCTFCGKPKNRKYDQSRPDTSPAIHEWNYDRRPKNNINL